jgi:hypothetical protein
MALYQAGSKVPHEIPHHALFIALFNIQYGARCQRCANEGPEPSANRRYHFQIRQ